MPRVCLLLAKGFCDLQAGERDPLLAAATKLVLLIFSLISTLICFLFLFFTAAVLEVFGWSRKGTDSGVHVATCARAASVVGIWGLV
jgi:hypothetical protein